MRPSTLGKLGSRWIRQKSSGWKHCSPLSRTEHWAFQVALEEFWDLVCLQCTCRSKHALGTCVSDRYHLALSTSSLIQWQSKNRCHTVLLKIISVYVLLILYTVYRFFSKQNAQHCSVMLFLRKRFLHESRVVETLRRCEQLTRMRFRFRSHYIDREISYVSI